ncbi:FecR family protein [Pedobacter sp. B4-66]|uniref:FecR family protein n=1 Tax=Pedobacter sp. B4-66 TaxID=2817280 RepID=UPI001BD9B2FB|nr:FecR family protein [Pedobacter sp. B4-66]
MDYSLYTIEDFLTDESFVKFCLRDNQEDIVFWENLLNQNPELSEKIHQAESLFFLLSVKIDPQEKERELSKLKSSIEHLQISESEHTPVKTIRLKSGTFWFSSAAAILICIGVYALMNKKDYSTTVPIYNEYSKNSAIKTGYNERKSITLSDGSIVLLNSLSILKIDDNYNEHNRVLWIDGEAHFSVAKNKNKPFIVISGKTATTALGTSFKINNYKMHTSTSIMLTTGKVSVGTVNDQEITNKVELIPGEQVEVLEAQNKFTKSNFDLQKVENWADRKLVFSMASLKDIKSVLKEIYGVEIITEKQPKKPIAFTGQFKNENLTDVLDAIGFANHFTYTIKNDTVTIAF